MCRRARTVQARQAAAVGVVPPAMTSGVSCGSSSSSSFDSSGGLSAFTSEAVAIPMALAGASPATLFDAQLAQVPTPAVNGVDFDGRWLYFRVADDIDNFLCVDTQDMAT
jgi:hypothetical protein